MVMTKGKNWRWEELEKDSIELGSQAKHFELYNKTEGKSPKTIVWYSMVLRQFHRFLIESEKSTKLGELNEWLVREFVGCWLAKANPVRAVPGSIHPIGNRVNPIFHEGRLCAIILASSPLVVSDCSIARSRSGVCSNA